MQNHPKTGYLNENFQLFHLKDQVDLELPFHYHDFHKIVIFLSGNVTYFIEGKSYRLKPWDILLVSHFDIHRVIVDTSVPYERVILWIRPDYMLSQNDEECNLSACFQKANQRSFHLIRLESRLQEQMRTTLAQLEESCRQQEFGSTLLRQAFFVQFMVYINRIFLDKLYIKDKTALKYDSQIETLLRFINTNLDEDLSVEAIAERFYISKYHLMRKFKDETGSTLHSYIVHKRLMHASLLISQGMPVMKAAEQSGFRDYTTFSRAYKKLYHTSPAQHRQGMVTAVYEEGTIVVQEE